MLTFLKSISRSQQTLLWVTLLSRIGGVVRPFLVVLAIESLHSSPAVAGTMLGLYGAGYFMASIIGGMATDRCGAYSVMIFSLIGSILVLALFPAANNVFLFSVASFALGFVIELFRPAASTYIANISNPTQLSRVYSLQHVMINVGSIIAPVVGTILVRYGVKPLLMWNGLFVVICLFLCWRYMRTSSVPWSSSVPLLEKKQQKNPNRSYMSMFVVGTAVITGFLFSLMYSQIPSLLPISLIAQGLPPTVYGSLLTLNAVGIVVLSYPLSALASTWPRFYGVGLGLLLACVGMLMFGFVKQLPLVFVAMGVVTIGEAIIFVLRQNLIAELASPGNHGKLFGVAHALFGAGFMVGPTASSYIYSTVGPHAAWTLSAAMGFLGFLLCMLSQMLIKKNGGIAYGNCDR